jgi:hypothetical protein
MFVKTSFLFTFLLLLCFVPIAQVMVLEENKPLVENGVEFGYIIKNEQLKTAKGEEYSRYELSLYVANKSGCTKLYANRTGIGFSDNANLIATFNCINANGKRFTSKSGTLRVKDFFVQTKRTVEGKEISELAKAGFIFRNGETINYNIIVLLPKGERPVVQAVANYLPAL